MSVSALVLVRTSCDFQGSATVSRRRRRNVASGKCPGLSLCEGRHDPNVLARRRTYSYIPPQNKVGVRLLDALRPTRPCLVALSQRVSPSSVEGGLDRSRRTRLAVHVLGSTSRLLIQYVLGIFVDQLKPPQILTICRYPICFYYCSTVIK
jgi:hypothetical protein